MCSFLFSGVLADHIQFSCHLVTLEGIEAVVQRFVITRDRAADTGSMGGEECTNSRAMFAQIEDGERGLPLVAVHDGSRHIEVLIQALSHLSDRIGEEATLIIVAIGSMTLYAILLPHVCEDLLFFSPQLVPSEEYSNRFTRHLPTAYAYALGTPTFQECFALFEGEIGVFSKIRTEENNFVFVFCLHGSGACGENGIDAAYTIAHLPTCLKNVLGLHDYLYLGLTTMRSISLMELYNIGVVEKRLFLLLMSAIAFNPSGVAQ